MKLTAAIAALLVSVPFAAFADGLEIQGQRFIVKVGQEAGIPKEGVATVTVDDSALALVNDAPESNVVTVKALKPGSTRILVTKASGTKVSYDLVVKL
jgi:hypothetical protein